jgi:molybdopterin synthase sulfur carrier subunit
VRITVRYFASVREAIGTGCETVETGAKSLATLRQELIERGGAYATALAPDRPVRMALDQVMSDGPAPLQEGCEVAFFPPVTGG